MSDSDPRRLPSPDQSPEVIAAPSQGTVSEAGALALPMDRDARPLPPWKLRPDLSPTSSDWTTGDAATSMAAWRRAYGVMTPSEQDTYRRLYPAPLYWFWFWNAPGIGRTLTVVLTFPLWMLIWAVVSTARGAFNRAS